MRRCSIPVFLNGWVVAARLDVEHILSAFYPSYTAIKATGKPAIIIPADGGILSF